MSSMVVLATPYLSKHASAASMRRSFAAWASLGSVVALRRGNRGLPRPIGNSIQRTGQRTFCVRTPSAGAGGGGTFGAWGVGPASCGARFPGGLERMKALWAQPEVMFAGRFCQVAGAAVEPKPFQRLYPPLWFGGNAPAALRRAVRHGDGF